MPELPRFRGGGPVPARAAAPSLASTIQPPRPDVQQTIAGFFRNLRRSLGLSPHQAAAELLIHADVIEALETGNFRALPAWPELTRVVLAYTALANVDGRPVLNGLASVLRPNLAQPRPVPQRPARSFAIPAPPERLRRAGSALKAGARRLPEQALQEVRQRPVRALYTMALPIGAVMLLLNTSLLQSAVAALPGSFVQVLEGARNKMSEQWAPVREGLRWIEVDDPRQRRGDKLQTSGKLQISGR
jgi:hypothetical protein